MALYPYTQISSNSGYFKEFSNAQGNGFGDIDDEFLDENSWLKFRMTFFQKITLSSISLFSLSCIITGIVLSSLHFSPAYFGVLYSIGGLGLCIAPSLLRAFVVSNIFSMYKKFAYSSNLAELREEMKEDFETLGLDTSQAYTKEKISSHARRKLRPHHPDNNGGEESEEFIRLANARDRILKKLEIYGLKETPIFGHVVTT